MVPRLYWPTIDTGNNDSIEDFFRRLVYIFIPWRNEEDLLTSNTCFEDKWNEYYAKLKVDHPNAHADIEKFMAGLNSNARRIANSFRDKQDRMQTMKDLDIDMDVSEEDIIKMMSRKVDKGVHLLNVSSMNQKQKVGEE